MTSRRGFLGAAGFGIARHGRAKDSLSWGVPTETAEDPEWQGSVSSSKPSKRKGLSPSRLEADRRQCISGPFHIKGAPHRAKLTPPLEPGEPLLIHGQVWSLDTGKPIPMATLDVWQANSSGEYDNRKTAGVTTPDDFHYRARLLTDEHGYYEFETIHPGAYKLGRSSWRPSHIHYLIQAPAHQTLVTQLYFKDDPRNEPDSLFKPSLAIDVEKVKTEHGEYESGVFDIVLKPEGA